MPCAPTLHYQGYRIVNRVTGLSYIGMTKMALQDRWWRHTSYARLGRRLRLYEAMREFGVEHFDIRPLATVLDPRDRWEVERELIAQWGTCGAGYNELPGFPRRASDPGVPRCFTSARDPIPAEMRQRIGFALRGRRNSPEVRAKKSAAQRGNRKAAGYRNTAESRTRRSLAKGGVGTVRYAGQEYPCAAAAAKVAGVTTCTFRAWIRRFGRDIPEATLERKRAWRWANRRSVTIAGSTYFSMSEAARAVGVSLDAIQRSARTGRLPRALRNR
jgi:hypothetical protein